ncbi:MAG: 1-acyl-sn-glycerol-3-phosphate acyltransferase [Proteobacteria bacterium]|nr:1-acyl-sn-glycerol-3-phosphate acyltransferase [Pseudomonadota bacterium]
MMLRLRSAAFLGFCFGSVCLYSTALLLIFWAPQDFLWRFVLSYARLAMWAGEFFCGMKIVVEGREHLPDEPSVVMIKHSSTLETYTHVTLFPRTCWVIKRETIFMPFFGWAIWLVFRPIAIRRNSRGAAVKQVIRQGTERLAEGLWVTIFPEGTRMPPGETRRYGVSGAALAQEAGVPIVPVAHNAADVWGRREFTKRPGTVRFCIGPPISAAGRPPRETNLLVQDWIENKMTEISSGYRRKRRAS